MLNQLIDLHDKLYWTCENPWYVIPNEACHSEQREESPEEGEKSAGDPSLRSG